MTTKELIEIANKCYDFTCSDDGYVCPYWGKSDCEYDLIKRLADRLEKAYDDLGKSECVTRKWAEECNQHDCDRDCNWVWEGDEE